MAGKRTKQHHRLICETAKWLSDQQEASGGFAPWRSHPVGENVYCTSVALLALISMNDTAYREAIERAYSKLILLDKNKYININTVIIKLWVAVFLY